MSLTTNVFRNQTDFKLQLFVISFILAQVTIFVIVFYSCEILGYHSVVADDASLLGCCAVSIGKQLSIILMISSFMFWS